MITSNPASSEEAGRPAITAPAVRRAAIWILAVTAACLPLYVVRWRVGPLPTTLLEVLILITAAVYAAVLWSERRLPAARTPYDIPIAMLLLAGVVGIAVAPDHTRALGIYRAYLIEPVVLFYIAVDLLRGRDQLRIFLAVAAIGASLMAVGQIVSFAWVAAHHELKLGDAPAFLNTSPNADAMYLEPPLAFAAAFTLFPSRRRERALAAPVLALAFVAVILTLSRASYLAMGVLAGVLVLTAQTPRWRLRAVGILAVLALVAIEIPFVNSRFGSLADSVSNRESLYRQALEMLSRMPITGAGISGFADRVAPYRPPGSVIHIYPHDLWLTTWSELGLAGVIAFAVIFFGLLWRGARALRSARDISRPLLWGSVAAIVLYAVHGLFDTPYWKNDLSALFWLVAALEVVGARLVPHADRAAAP